jgi:N-acetylglucosamine-6-phosphate deacetylase
MTLALVNGRILSGRSLLHDRCVLIEGERIAGVVTPDDPRCRQARRQDLQGQLLLPGFIDVQVNGGGGVLFAEDPSVAAIRAIGAAHRRFGTTGFLPTLISADLAVMAQAIAAAREALAARVPGLLGLHLEGPFLNVARAGVHDAARLQTLEPAALALLTSLGRGRTLVTLAPEMTTPQIITQLTTAGVLVSAGHTDATHAQLRVALAHGLRGFTHLFNAMSPLTAREPGAVGAALEDPGSWCGIIVDGVHVDPVVLRLALRCKSPERFMLVTDAMPTVGTRQPTFRLQGRTIRVRGAACVDEHGRLAGSNLDMASCVRNAVRLLGLTLAQAVAMASEVPASFLALEDVGRIAAGCRANLVLADEALNVLETWIDGESAAAAQPAAGS